MRSLSILYTTFIMGKFNRGNVSLKFYLSHTVLIEYRSEAEDVEEAVGEAEEEAEVVVEGDETIGVLVPIIKR
jgi:hypothetical protein